MYDMQETVSDSATGVISSDLVCFNVVRGRDRARACVQTLQDYGVLAILGEEVERPGAHGPAFPVLVSASSGEFASELVAALEVSSAEWDDSDDDFDDDDDVGDDDDDFYDDDDDDDDDDYDDDDDEFEDFDEED